MKETLSSSHCSIDILIERFLAKTLPKSQWTHEAHLRVGLWHVVNYGAEDAMNLLRERIRAYNESVGTQNTATSGYHESITQFYVLIIARFLGYMSTETSIDALVHLLIAEHGDHELPLQYYSPEKLFSTEARLHWIEPDKRSID